MSSRNFGKDSLYSSQAGSTATFGSDYPPSYHSTQSTDHSVNTTCSATGTTGSETPSYKEAKSGKRRRFPSSFSDLSKSMAGGKAKEKLARSPLSAVSEIDDAGEGSSANVTRPSLKEVISVGAHTAVDFAVKHNPFEHKKYLCPDCGGAPCWDPSCGGWTDPKIQPLLLSEMKSFRKWERGEREKKEKEKEKEKRHCEEVEIDDSLWCVPK